MAENNSKDHPYVLSIDLGTSGAKTALVSIYGHVAGFEYEPVPLHLFDGGGAEQDPADWWQGIVKTSKRLLSRNLVPTKQIVAINASTQWAGTVPVDAEGNHLMNAVIWMDSRGESYVRKTAGGPISIVGYDIFKLMRWIRLTGGAPPLSGKDAYGHIPYIRHKHPDIYQKTDTFLEPKDYINMRLTGIKAASFDSITFYWSTDNRDINNIKYDQKLLNIGKLDRSKLPDLIPTNSILGPVEPSVAKILGLPEGLPVVAGSPDLMAASVGSGATKDFETHLYIGTSSWLLAHVPFKKCDILHNMASLPSGIPGRYLICNEQETAGASLTFLKDNLLYPKEEQPNEGRSSVDYDTLDNLAAQAPPGSNNLMFTPWLNGERAPVEENFLRACLFNMSLQTTRADMVRAVFEGVALNHKWLLFYVEKFMKRETKAIHMVGGGAKSAVWCQIHADVLNRPIRQVKDPIQSNVRGSAFLAAVALGYFGYDDIAQYIEIEKTFEPNPKNRELYDQRFKVYLKFYKQNRKVFRFLNAG